MSRRLPAFLVAWLLVGAALPVAAERPAREQARRERVERAFSGAPDSFRSWVEGLPPEQRRPLLRRLVRMPEPRRERLFHRWDGADEAERERFKRFFQERAARRAERGRGTPGEWGGHAASRRLESLPPEQLERWRGMEPGERHRMRRRLERFRTLSEQEQEALIEERFGSRTPEERARILESLREASRALPDRRRPPQASPDPTVPD